MPIDMPEEALGIPVLVVLLAEVLVLLAARLRSLSSE